MFNLLSLKMILLDIPYWVIVVALVILLVARCMCSCCVILDFLIIMILAFLVVEAILFGITYLIWLEMMQRNQDVVTRETVDL